MATSFFKLYNSFVASNNNHTYQIGICFPQKFRGGLVATDVLSIYAVVVPIESKEIPDVIAGTMEALQKMGKKPQIIYTDDEGAVTSNDFRQYVEDEAKMAWWSERNVRGSKRKDCGGQKKKTAGQKKGCGSEKKGCGSEKKGCGLEKKDCGGQKRRFVGQKRRVVGQKRRVAGVRKKGLWIRKEGLWVRKDVLWVRKEECGGQKKRDCESIVSHGQHRHSDEEERDAEGERICFLSVERARGV